MISVKTVRPNVANAASLGSAGGAGTAGSVDAGPIMVISGLGRTPVGSGQGAVGCGCSTPPPQPVSGLGNGAFAPASVTPIRDGYRPKWTTPQSVQTEVTTFRGRDHGTRAFSEAYARGLRGGQTRIVR